ncbi:MAG: hypothetical protein FJ403_10875, partial [Verrucomicrobia bacterium]|nr:hypothetical protein [Verrucomicrobiota bacterium]
MKPIQIVTLVVLSLTSSLYAAGAKPHIPTYLTEDDARPAGPDFDLQGEYSNSELGAQVVALGNDTFRVVLHKGGLPGAGWDKPAKIEIEGKREGDKVEFANDVWKAALKKNELSGQVFSLAPSDGERVRERGNIHLATWQNCILRIARKFERFGRCGRYADYKSAIRQTETQWVREWRCRRSLPVVAMRSIPHIYRRAGFPLRATPRLVAR